MSTVLIIAGMVAVTYVPRLLPFVLKREGEPPDWLKRTLQLLPFTAIGALIIPGVFTSVSGGLPAAAAGIVAAAVITWLTRQPFLAVIGAVLAVLLVQTLV